MVSYYLRATNKSLNPVSSFMKILEYLMTFVGDIEVKKINEKSAIIFYIGTPNSAYLRLEKDNEIVVQISPDDNITISLIKNIANNLGLRIYNPQIKSYLLNDVNIMDLTTIKIDPTIKNVLKEYQLTPLFQYKGSLIFFAMAKDKSIHMINRHLLEYLMEKPNLPKQFQPKEFSTKVANTISEFVALFDRGLISLNFQNYINGSNKIINLSGFNLEKLSKDTKLQIINFIFDNKNQSFIQKDSLDVIPQKYMALKIGQDYTYKVVDGKLTKFLNVSVFS